MSHRLIDLNEDLRKLREEGYNIDVHANHLVIRDVPYLSDKVQICRGTLVSTLDADGDIVNRPSDHTMKFAGDHPCGGDGQPLAGIRHSSNEVRISERLTVQHSFSSKPPRGHYESYYEKVKTYVAIIEGPARNIDPNVTARTYLVVVARGG